MQLFQEDNALESRLLTCMGRSHAL